MGMVPEMARSLLGLVMIVRQEAYGIAEVLRSFKPYIDRWLIFDTGSTDGTQDIVHRELDGIPGCLVEGDFIDFSTARNRALDAFERVHPEVPFVVMPDADDVLVHGEDLLTFLAARLNDDQPAYLLNRSRSAYLPLVMRTAAKCRYRGRVHEQLDVTATMQIPGAVLNHHVRPQNNEAKIARWQRDRVILQEDLVADPNDARAWFYLAQTLECLDIPEKAIEFYQRRILMGGDSNEVFEARLRIGKILRRLKRPWPEIVAVNLETHLADPRRAEPLQEIAEIFHEGNHHALTYLFASRAAALPLPLSPTTVNKEIYDYKAADLVAISAFYLAGQTGDRDVRSTGKRCSDRCVKVKGDMRMRANRAYYTEDAAHLEGPMARGPACFIEEIGWKPIAPYHASTPSIARVVVGTKPGYEKFGIASETRYAWRCILGITRSGYTQNVMLELDDQLAVTRAVPMDDLPFSRGETRTDFSVHGYTDCRLFSDDRGQLYATTTACDLGGSRELCLLVINPTTYAIESCVPLRGPWSHHAQRNWMPAGVREGVARFVYRTEPRPVFVDVTLDPVAARWPDPAISTVPGYLRGGSQVVEVWDGAGWRLPHVPAQLAIVHEEVWDGAGWRLPHVPAQLAIVHEVVSLGGEARINSHRFVLFDKTCTRILGMSDLFYFKHRGIELCAGLAIDGRRLVASFSVQDSAAYFATFDLPTVLAAIKTDYVV